MGGFFCNKAQGDTARVISVGNEQFHAAAVALLDSFYSLQHGNEAVLKKTLEQLYHYFPKYITTQPFLTLLDRVKILLNHPRKTELVECMAYVLRQITVDGLYADPVKYREVFEGLTGETPKSYLRDPAVKLPPSAMNALANLLQIPITLSFTGPGKELRKRVVYYREDAIGSAKFGLFIQVQGDNQYFPVVKHEKHFAYVGQLAIIPPKPVEDATEQGETLAAILSVISQDNKKLLQSYDQWRHTISSMVGAGELTLAQLIKLYITFLPAQSSSTLSLSALEHLINKPVITGGVPMQEEQYTKEHLVKTLAYWIGIGQIQPESLFDQIENQPQKIWATG